MIKHLLEQSFVIEAAINIADMYAKENYRKGDNWHEVDKQVISDARKGLASLRAFLTRLDRFFTSVRIAFSIVATEARSTYESRSFMAGLYQNSDDPDEIEDWVEYVQEADDAHSRMIWARIGYRVAGELSGEDQDDPESMYSKWRG